MLLVVQLVSLCRLIILRGFHSKTRLIKVQIDQAKSYFIRIAMPPIKYLATAMVTRIKKLILVKTEDWTSSSGDLLVVVDTQAPVKLN